MKAPRLLERTLDGLVTAATLDELGQRIFDIRDRYGVEHIVYHSVNASGGQYAALTYDKTWVDQYIEQDYARLDPVVQGCFRRFTAVDWKDLDWSGRAQRAFLSEALDSGVGNQGLSIPIRGPLGRFALFTVNGSGSDREWQAFTRTHLNELILVAHYVNERALEIEGGKEGKTQRPLSPREVDALTLLALGQSRAQAAEALNISEHTLRAYIESARLKLGALNTTHAVARALVQGFLVV